MLQGNFLHTYAVLWKSVSIVLTGIFGLIALFGEARDKSSNRMTIFGKIAIGGIVSTVLLGTLAQSLESSEAEKKQQEDSAKALETAATTLLLVKRTADLLENSRRTNKQISRLATGIDDTLIVEIIFVLECNRCLPHYINKNTKGIFSEARLYSPANKLTSDYKPAVNHYVPPPIFVEDKFSANLVPRQCIDEKNAIQCFFGVSNLESKALISGNDLMGWNVYLSLFKENSAVPKSIVLRLKSGVKYDFLIGDPINSGPNVRDFPLTDF